jgi:hypothetical protein
METPRHRHHLGIGCGAQRRRLGVRKWPSATGSILVSRINVYAEPISSWFRSARCQVRAKRYGRDVCRTVSVGTKHLQHLSWRAGRSRRAGRRRRAGRSWRAGRRRRAGRSRISIQALLKFVTTWGVVEAAVAIMNFVWGGKRIAIGGISRGRWCGPHNTSGPGCRCSTDGGHQYSRLHVGIPFLWKTTALCRRSKR